MAGRVPSGENSTETIYTFENRSPSNWSTMISTTHVPGMDAAMGGAGTSRRTRGRRRLRVGTLALGAFLTMHCRMSASAVSGGFFIFILLLIISVVILGNPLRHFEIYLGQWSISGPGRAFRMIPMFDGIGIAICINAIIRAITCVTIAALAAVYVLHSVADHRLPFTYCRDFKLKTYEATVKQNLRSDELTDLELATLTPSTVGFRDSAWRNLSLRLPKINATELRNLIRKAAVCKERYPGPFPPFYQTPAYNFFYVEVVHVRPDLSISDFNVAVLSFLMAFWIILWLVMIKERIIHGRLIWNNMYSWFVVVPCIWAVFMIITAAINIPSLQRILDKAYKLGSMDVLATIGDALQTAMYIHASSTGTEIILGKGLNHYASGHIDTNLNNENVWHSALLLLLAVLNSISSTFCALSDLIQVTSQESHVLHESALWVLPMYSKCTSSCSYSHFLSTIVFAGITFSYLVVAYTFLKAALHTIFEYRVKLVFVEQFIVAGLMIVCMGLSLFFVFVGGVVLLETVDAIMTGVTMPLVCFLELIVMMWVYRSRDFISDLNVATEDNTCPTRVGTQFQIVPFIVVVTVGLKIVVLCQSELPSSHLYWALLPLFAVVLAVPVRAIWNTVNFFKPSRNT